jgi:hypothetical protein
MKVAIVQPFASKMKLAIDAKSFGGVGSQREAFTARLRSRPPIKLIDYFATLSRIDCFIEPRLRGLVDALVGYRNILL